MATVRKGGVRQKTEGSYHHGDLRQALKQAALRLVRTKGARGFSLNEASRLAGVSVGAPYRHFADKDALLAELAVEGYERLEREVRAAAATGEGARGRLLEAGMGYLGFAAGHADYFAVMFAAGLDVRRYPEVRSAGERAYGVLRELAEEVAPAAADQIALAAWGMVHGLAVLRAEGALTEVEGGAAAGELRAALWSAVQGMGRKKSTKARASK